MGWNVLILLLGGVVLVKMGLLYFLLMINFVDCDYV